MPDITGTVGQQGQNRKHDVALVQLMLRVVKNAQGVAYFGGNYDGLAFPPLLAAIAAFQADHKLAASSSAPSLTGARLGAAPGFLTPATGPRSNEPNACTVPSGPEWATMYMPASFGATQAMESGGLMRPGGPTIRKLTELLPSRLKTMRTAPGCTVVYLPGDATAAARSANAISTSNKFTSEFGQALARLVNLMYERTGIVLSVTNSGWRRTFDEQYALFLQGPSITGAGPGESNHNWGNGTDIGPDGLRWLRHDGTPVRDDWWLNQLSNVRAGQWSMEIWKARNAIAIDELGLFPSKKKGDLVHLQAFDDDRIHMARSLVGLLNDVGAMKWSYVNYVNDDYVYGCDLGGTTKVTVGTAAEIWSGKAPIDADAVAKATGRKAADVKPEEVAALKAKLKDDFAKADTSWRSWKPVYKS